MCGFGTMAMSTQPAAAGTPDDPRLVAPPRALVSRPRLASEPDFLSGRDLGDENDARPPASEPTEEKPDWGFDEFGLWR